MLGSMFWIFTSSYYPNVEGDVCYKYRYTIADRITNEVELTKNTNLIAKNMKEVGFAERV